MFKKYIHIERLGKPEVEGIEVGVTYIFPKIDGTNASVWFDNGLKTGSRTKEITPENDNAGFAKFVQSSAKLNQFFKEFPDVYLYGEWLVPHSLKTYKDTAWKKFYIFDVMQNDKFIPYEFYKPMLEKYNLDYISPIAIIQNGSEDQYVKLLQNNNFLIEDGNGIGEGIVIKNYYFENKYKRTTWAKIVTSEFKEVLVSAPEMKGVLTIEERITKHFLTETLIEKEYQKIKLDGWDKKKIPQLLNTVFYTLIQEEMWSILKKFGMEKIDFKRLQTFVFAKIRSVKKDLF